jgi:hypothetical protein
MARGARNMIDSGIKYSDPDESRRRLKMKEALEKGYPFPLMLKGERREA